MPESSGEIEARVLARLGELIKQSRRLLDGFYWNYLTSGRELKKDAISEFEAWRAMSVNFFERVTGTDSTHGRRFFEVITKVEQTEIGAEDVIRRVLGLMQALEADLKSGFLFRRDLAISNEVFDDVLKQAEHLSNAGLKDAAAAMAGAILESTLRKICSKHGLAVEDSDSIATLNKKLTGGVFNKVTERHVTAWAAIRNAAAHGHFDEYDGNAVAHMIDGVTELAASHLT